MGLPRFFPVSPVTQIIYNSMDAGGGFYRIPATFTSAHSFGGTMVFTMPFLVGLWSKAENKRVRLLALAGIFVAMLGVLLSATRTNFIFGSAMILFVIFTTKMKTSQKAFFIVIIAAIGMIAMGNVRFQRFKTLGDTEGVADRVAGSVNRDFVELLTEYPMGNGLGGAGSSIPYFLRGQVRNPIGMENEYARILGEQGIIGLLLWVSLVVWFILQAPTAFAKGPWATTRRLVWCLAAVDLGTAFIGLGLLTSIPGTVFLVLGMGWTSTPEEHEATVPSPVRRPVQQIGYVPAQAR
jgi:O-antigen ligase